MTDSKSLIERLEGAAKCLLRHGGLEVHNGTDVFPEGDTDARYHIADFDPSGASLRREDTESITDFAYFECQQNASDFAELVNSLPEILSELKKAGEMREALRPFAKFAIAISPLYRKYSDTHDFYRFNTTAIKLGDLRRAAALTNGDEQ